MGGDRGGKMPGAGHCALTEHLPCAGLGGRGGPVPPAPRAGRLEVARPQSVAQCRPPAPLSPGLVGRQLGREKRPLPAATAGLQIKGGQEPSRPPGLPPT